MRVASVGKMKRASELLGGLPAEGTKLRLAYDVFFEHRGRYVPDDEMVALRAILIEGQGTHATINATVANLSDQYGCDFRKKFFKLGPHRSLRTYALVGEWCGRTYIDYTAPAVAAARASAFARPPALPP